MFSSVETKDFEVPGYPVMLSAEHVIKNAKNFKNRQAANMRPAARGS